ncbi:MAG: gamma-glutamylcyclotransferase family protein [Candidatus Gracilibacteria bacterium]
MTLYYFAYGSNMNPERMKERGINFEKREVGILLDAKLVFNKKVKGIEGRTVANILPEAGSIVEGALYTTTEEDISKLDIFEGVPHHYQRYTKEIQLSTLEKIEAVVYIANEEVQGEGMPIKEYLEHLLVGKDILSREYFERLTQVQTRE